jgi:predicted RecA/RadA family phage recombinase
VFTKDGPGAATGSTRVDKGASTGTVIFTNNGANPVKIPTGIIVETANGVQFTTTAEAVVSPAGSSVGNLIPVPIQAANLGPNGDVGSGTITVIPQASLSQIAAASSLAPSDLKLTVNNTVPTQGGAATSEPSVTAADLNNVKKTLRAQLNNDIAAWVQKQLVKGDVHGDPAISSATLTKAPKEGDIEVSGTFQAELQVSVTLLVVHSTDLQNAAAAQLNNTIKRNKAFADSRIIVDAQHPITINQGKIKVSGSPPSLTLTFPASAKAIPDIQPSSIQTLVAGKPPRDAQALLKGITDVQSVQISVWPGFMPWITSFSPRIDVHLVPAAAPPPPVKPRK